MNNKIIAMVWKSYCFYNLIVGAEKTIIKTVQEKGINGSDI
jgi:hypothetical protein